MFNENNGLIKRKLYKGGLVKFNESDHYGNQDVYKMFSNSYWDSYDKKFPAWMKIDFSVAISFSAYSFKIPFKERSIVSWSIFDSNGEEIDRRENNDALST